MRRAPRDNVSGAGHPPGGEASGPSPSELVERLAALPGPDGIPRSELEWLVSHGRFEAHEAGAVIASKGQPLETLWVILSGRITVRVDRGAGPRSVVTWEAGEVTGKLPYSRMIAPPGDNYLEERSEILVVHQRDFPEMVHRCPEFTTLTVHLMLDRARSFKATDLQDEKLISLGKLAAGLAHELNNPASAAVRGAKLLREGLATTDAALRALGASGLTGEQLEAIHSIRSACVVEPDTTGLSPLAQAERESRIDGWLARHRADHALAGPLADTAVTIEILDSLAEATTDETLRPALEWIAAACSAHALTLDVERAATRIHELVAAVKRFTYMDRAATPEPVDLETALRDTVRVMASKVKTKAASVTLDVEDGLPPAQGVGAELNQVWTNLLDNALDAIPESGEVRISAHGELDRVVVSFVDNGPGIPQEVLSQIFDPFFTTKAPGEGTGLGLDIAQRLVRRNKGEITIESRPGRTEFRVSLPATAQVDEPRQG